MRIRESHDEIYIDRREWGGCFHGQRGKSRHHGVSVYLGCLAISASQDKLPEEGRYYNLLFPFPLSHVHSALPGLISPIYLVTWSSCHLVTLSPCHLVTLSPCHLVTLSPCHLVTLSPYHPITSSLVSPLHHVTPHLDTLLPGPRPRIILTFVLILSLTRPCLDLDLTTSLSSPCPYLDLLLPPYTPEYSLS